MSFPLTPSKRPHEWSSQETNGKGKWQNSTGFRPQNRPKKLPPDNSIFRVLCLAAKSGSVIGEGGTIVNQICQETGAKVEVEETVPGCDERVVVIADSDKDREGGKEQGKEEDEQNDNAGAKEQDDENGDEEPVQVEDAQSGKVSSSAQKALLLVFERMVEGELDTNNSEGEASEKSSTIVFRMFVLPTQVGCILGKGGSVIKQITAESGAQLRIFPRDKLPVCALPSDELVQIAGEVDAVRKALLSVSKQLLENPPRDHDPFSACKPIGPSTLSFGPPFQPEVNPPKNYHFHVQGGPPFAAGPRDVADHRPNLLSPVPKFHNGFNPGHVKPAQDKLSFRLLCTNDKVGGVIGKGGSIIKTLKHETGCGIKILDGVPDVEDRIIVISGPAHPDDSVSAPQDALLRVQSRIVMATPDSQEKTVLSRILVPSNQIGCLLGKGGNIIAEMRKSSGANIHIMGKNQIPKCASKDEEVVKITGDFEAVQEALLQITSRLRHYLFHGRFAPVINHSAHPPFSDQVGPVAPYMGRGGYSPARMFPHFDSSFQKFDQVGGIPPNDDRPSFAHGLPPTDQRHPFAQGFPPSDERHPFAHGLPPTDQRDPFAHGFPPSDERHPFPHGLPPSDERHPFPHGLPPTDRRHPFAHGFPPSDERHPFPHGLPPSGERHPFPHGLPSNDERRPFPHGHPPNDERHPFPRGLPLNEERPFPHGLPSNVDQHPFPRGLPPNDERPPFAHGFPPNDLRAPFAQSLPTNDERYPFAHSVQKPGFPPPNSERIPSSVSWTRQGVGGSTGVFDHADGAQQRGVEGFGSGSQLAVITGTTVEVVVPRALVPSIYGQDGESLRQIRQISGAKITITEPRPEALETVIIIAGTSEQTHAAQSLLQAFVLSGQGSP